MRRSKNLVSLALVLQLLSVSIVSAAPKDAPSPWPPAAQSTVVQPDKPSVATEEPVDQVFSAPVSSPVEESGHGLMPSSGDPALDLKSYPNSPQIITDESYHPLEISLKDISRIVCFRAIDRVIYSKEKGVEIKTIDKNAFVKNLPREIQEPTGKVRVEYDLRPKELYMVCGSKTFSLLLIPRDIPATTIFLKSSFAEKDKALEFEKASTHEDLVLALIKDAYFETVPAGYEVRDINKPLREFQEIKIAHIRDYMGALYTVQELAVTAKMPIALDETVLLEAIMPTNAYAITIVNHNLRPTEQTRVFIVRMPKDE